MNPGQRIGPFEIVSLLGRGGMGEVFLATDTRLDRKVAIKVLPAEFASDRQRLCRFEQEAKTLASLDHPNILSIFEVGTHESAPYLVSQFLEGNTLREELKSGALPQRRAIDYALQIAHGLAAAHAKGITHRDLKPENIFITKDGRVKILDFGLAKLRSTPKSQIANRKSQIDGEAVTLVQTTEPGAVLGTVGYMSPEQVRGEEADHRSDIFAFGCILYEMLSGRRAFRKETGVQTMNSILTEDPPDLAADNPALERIVRRCLEKPSERRFQSASDLAFAFEGLAGASTSVKSLQATAAAPRVRPSILAVTVTSAVALLGLSFWIGRLQNHQADAAPMKWRGERLGGPAVALEPTISPDGKELAFRAMEDGLTQVAVMMIDSGVWKLLTTNRAHGLVGGLAWSADGTEIFYDRLHVVPKGVFRISKYGGDERLFLEHASSPQLLPDGSLLVRKLSTNNLSQLYRYSSGGRLDPLNALLANQDNGPSFYAVPDGKRVIFFGWPASKIAGGETWRVLDLQSGRCQELPEPPPPRVLDWVNTPMVGDPQDNSIIYVEPAGNSYRLISTHLDNWTTKRFLMQLTLAPLSIDLGLNRNLYVDQVERPAEIWRLDHTNIVQRIPLSSNYEKPQVLPLRGGRFLVQSYTAGKYRLMLMAGRGEPVPFIPAAEESREPLAFLGQDKIICRVRTDTNWTVAIVSLDGRILDRLSAIPADQGLFALAGSPDGKTVYYVADRIVWSVSVEGGQPQKIRAGHGVAPDPHGKYLVIQAAQGEGNVLIRVSLVDGSEQPIRTQYPLTLWPITPNAIGPNGHIVLPVAPLDLWFWPAAILDPATGEMQFLGERHVDMLSPGWDHEGNLVTSAQLLRASLWRFQFDP